MYMMVIAESLSYAYQASLQVYNLPSPINEQVHFYLEQFKFPIAMGSIAVVHLAGYFQNGIFLLISDQSLTNNRIHNLLSFPLL